MGSKQAKENVDSNGVVQPKPAPFVIKQVLQKTIFRWTDGERRAFKINGPVEITMMRAQYKKDKFEQEVFPVTDLNTGEVGLLISYVELKDRLEDVYPNGGYIGKCFVATREPRNENVRGRTFFVAEIEEPKKG